MNDQGLRMKVLLYCVSALPFFACASLNLAKVEHSCEETNEPESSQHSKERTKQGLFNPTGISENVNTREIHGQVAKFVPEMQDLFSKASKSCREAMARYPVFRDFLAERMGIERMNNIPYHCDLKVFEHFEFSKTSEGRAEAAALIYKMAKTILALSPIQPKLMEIVYDEFLDLANASQECFERFSLLIDMENSFSDHEKKGHFILFCLKSGRTADLIRIHKIIPFLLSSLESLPINSMDEFVVSIKALITQVNANPEDAKIICEKPTSTSIFCVLASDLSMEIIKELLQDILAGIPFDQVLEWAEKILNIPLPRFDIIPELFDSKLLEFIDFCKSLYVSDYVSYDLANEKNLRLIARCRSDSFLIPAALLDGRRDLKFYLMAAGRYELVLALLPETEVSEFVLEYILDWKEFVILLAEHKPEWVRKHYAAHKRLLLLDSNLFKAFYDVSSIADFLELAADEDLEMSAAFIFRNGSLQEVELLAAKVDVNSLTQLFKTLFDIEMDLDRFKAILSILFTIKDAKYQRKCYQKKLAGCYPEGITLLALLEVGGVGLLNRLSRWSYSTDAVTLIRQVMLDPELRARIPPFQADLPDLFCVSRLLYSPSGLYANVRLHNREPVEYLKHALKGSFRAYEENSFEVDNYFLIMVSLSRSWFKVDPTIANYSDSDFAQKTLDDSNHESKEFCKCLYSSLSSCGKAILRFVFAEAEKFNHPPPQQAAAVAQVEDVLN